MIHLVKIKSSAYTFQYYRTPLHVLNITEDPALCLCPRRYRGPPSNWCSMSNTKGNEFCSTTPDTTYTFAPSAKYRRICLIRPFDLHLHWPILHNNWLNKQCFSWPIFIIFWFQICCIFSDIFLMIFFFKSLLPYQLCFPYWKTQTPFFLRFVLLCPLTSVKSLRKNLSVQIPALINN